MASSIITLKKGNRYLNCNGYISFNILFCGCSQTPYFYAFHVFWLYCMMVLYIKTTVNRWVGVTATSQKGFSLNDSVTSLENVNSVILKDKKNIISSLTDDKILQLFEHVLLLHTSVHYYWSQASIKMMNCLSYKENIHVAGAPGS